MGAPPGTPSHWLAYFTVADADASFDAVGDGGGSVLMAPEDTPFGRIGVVRDPFGATFGLHGAPAGGSENERHVLWFPGPGSHTGPGNQCRCCSPQQRYRRLDEGRGSRSARRPGGHVQQRFRSGTNMAGASDVSMGTPSRRHLTADGRRSPTGGSVRAPAFILPFRRARHER